MEGELVLACHVWLFFSVLFLFSYDVHQQDVYDALRRDIAI